MDLPWWLTLLVLVVCAGASCFFALAETSIFSLGPTRARKLGERPNGAAVTSLLASSNDVLATLVLGNSMANAFMVALALFVSRDANLPVAGVVIGLLALVVLGCEVVPKALAVREPEFWSVRVAAPLALIVRLSRPVRAVAQGIVDGILKFLPASVKPMGRDVDAEYSALIELAARQGALHDREKEIIAQILAMDSRTAGDVMRPRAQVHMLPDDLPVDEMIAAARKSRHHRLPLFDGTPDTIVGVLNTRTLLLSPEDDISESIEFPSFVPESMNLLRLFESLQRQGRGIAIVLDEFGGNAGLVTLQDILEGVIGRIRTDRDSEKLRLESIGEGRWKASGNVRIDDFRRECPELTEDDTIDTLGGWVVKQAEVVPAAGTQVTSGNLRFTVTEADERRVRELIIERIPAGGRSR